ncbi:ATP-binding protein [Streptomyces sp. AD55]|uniref:ATP-binding protein n=1 Tax=Streptomyces sp. AD55 TaxID=3242895 RepID=UPI0035274BD5
MTTTPVRIPGAVFDRDGHVMSERLRVAPGRDGAAPSAGDARRVGDVRRSVPALLRQCGLEALADDVTLIVSELLTNAVQHGGSPEIALEIAVTDGSLRIAVRDGVPGTGVPGRPEDTAETGRGLLLVDALVREHGGAWGTGGDGAETWCRLPAPAGWRP